MDVRERMKEQERAKRWLHDTAPDVRWELMDQFFNDTFDWREWGFERRPSNAFLRAVKNQLWEWEDTYGFNEKISRQ